jgi:hypothetical protein
MLLKKQKATGEERASREGLEYGDDFYDIRGMIHKIIIDKLDSIKIFCFVKDDVKKIKRQALVWEKIFAKTILDKETSKKIHKKLFKTQ